MNSTDPSRRRQRRLRLSVGLVGLVPGLLAGIVAQWPSEYLGVFALHLGELFATNVYLYSGSPDGPAMTSHGALDWLPAAVTGLFVTGTAHIQATVLLLAGCVVAAQVVFLGLLESLLPRDRDLLPVMFTAGLITSQTVHYRDLGLVVTLTVLYRSLASYSRQPRWIAAVGVVAYLGFLWSWSRGLPGLVAVVGACTLMAILGRERRFWLGPLAVLGTAVVMALVSPLFGAQTLIDNVTLLTHVAETTHLEWNGERLSALVGFLLLAATAGGFLVAFLLRQPRSAQNAAQVVVWLPLLLASGEIALYRFDLEHRMMLQWVALCVLVITAPVVLVRVPPRTLLLAGCLAVGSLGLLLGPAEPQTAVFAATILLGVAASLRLRMAILGWCVLAIVVSMAHVLQSAWAAQIWGLTGPRPSGGPAPSSDEQWLLNEISQEACLVDLTNRGLLNELSGVPSCFRYGSLLWVPNDRQPELIARVEAQRPDRVVWPRVWGPAYSFEGLPDFVAYVERTFPVVTCRGDECIRERAAAGVA